jgi:hypothetical protein
MPGRAGCEIGMRMGDDRNTGSAAILKYPSAHSPKTGQGMSAQLQRLKNLPCVSHPVAWDHLPPSRYLVCPESIRRG